VSAAEPSKLPVVKFTDTRLENGLRVLIAEDHYAPVFSIAVSYNVGSRDERKGRTGFAHLFEHMMFKGSEKVGPGEHFFLIFNNGGNMNGTTNTDRTLYFETLPKNQLDLALFLEADRMRSLDINKENLANQQEAVKEERRLGIDNRPYGRSFERIDELAYDNFAYKHSVIGSMNDLNSANIEDVKEFFRIYYAPNNAALALVGDLDTKTALAKVRQYFGAIPRQSAPQPVDLNEPDQKEERRETIEDKLARLPQVLMAYKAPRGNTPDSVALGVLGTILAGGESSRLHQKLVKEKEVAVSVNAFPDFRPGPGLYQILAMVRAGRTAKEAESLITEEIERLQKEPVSEQELKKARSMARRGAISSRESSLNRAIRLADDAVLYNDPNRLNTMLDKQLAVTAEDIQRVAKTYLRTTNRSVIHTLPVGKAN
jgi:predicted Zn-dependent peptidase